jgi:hypothetical protein
MKNLTNNETIYPIISDVLIQCLKRDFPNKLPQKEVSQFVLGRLIGQQDVIEKLEVEKDYNENSHIDDDEDV